MSGAVAFKAEQIGENRWLLFDDPRLLDWCAAHIPNCESIGWHREGAQGIGVAIGEEIIAVMVAHNYEPAYRSVEISMAATRPVWARRSTIRKALNYLFGQLKVDRVTAHIASLNKRSLKLADGFGFVREGLMINGCGDDHRVVLGLTRTTALEWGLIDGR